MSTSQLRNQHLMWRAGFGPASDQLSQLNNISHHQLYKALRKASDKKPVALDAADDYLKGLWKGIEEEGRRQQMEKEDRRKFQQKNRQSIRNLNLMWLDQMVDSDAQLREKMAFFWHGHFAARNLNIFFQQELLQVIRENALGNFGDLLAGVSRSAAMLNFLNANQNRKDKPNENFAREVMELFTLGRGHYTEQDVKEAARAFTGWGANVKGEFVFRRFQHDSGSKTILGRTGNFDGDEVLEILLEQKQAARFITEKIYRFFVNEKTDQEKISWLSDRFYKSGYNIGSLMDDIFSSEWFYNEKNIGTRIKSPIELLAGLKRMLPMELENEEVLLLMQRILGQTLFYPPNVAGWPGGRSWIDSSTLMMRMRIPQLITDKDELNVTPKSDDDQMMGRPEKEITGLARLNMGRSGQPIRADISWELYLKHFESIPREKLYDAIRQGLLQLIPSFKPELITKYADSRGRELFVKSATIQVMSTPEYQMC